ncbi:g2367 [Coccomyxa viridis]|uniref:G2367 protein n=1 Tax=Coccomyxa viridis TaxID=1274662 RepID=A0ABP1FK83_9CHLO
MDNHPFDARPLLTSRARIFHKGLLYLDSGAGELLASTAGLDWLLSRLGVSHVCALETSSPRDEAAARLLSGGTQLSLVVVTTRLLTEVHGMLIRLLQVHRDTPSCTILCTYSEEAHAGHSATMLGLEAYTEYKTALLEDLSGARAKAGQEMSRQCPDIRIEHLPMHACWLEPHSFVLPAASSANLAACSADAILDISSRDGANGDSTGDADSAKLIAHALLDIAFTAKLRLEVFSIGHHAHTVEEEVSDLVQASPAAETAALVLVDRNLDVVTPLSPSDHPLDQIWGCLPRRACLGAFRPQSSDVAVPLPQSFGVAPAAKSSSQDSAALQQQNEERLNSHATASASAGMVQGTLLSPEDPKMSEHLAFLMGRSSKDARMYLRKWLREALRHAGIQPKTRSKVGAASAEELHQLSMMLATAGPPHCWEHLSIAQLGFAAAAAGAICESDRWRFLDTCHGELLQACAKGAPGVLTKLQDCLATAAELDMSKAQRCSLADLLSLCLVSLAYISELSLSKDPSNLGQMASGLADPLTDTIMKGVVGTAGMPWLQGIEQHFVELGDIADADAAGHGAKGSREGLRQDVKIKVSAVLAQLCSAARARGGLKDMRRYLAHGAGSKAASSYLGELTARMLSGQPVADMQQNAASLSGLLKSGLGRLGIGQSAALPAQHSKIIILVLGGISMADVRAVRQEVLKHASSGGSPEPKRSPSVYVGGMHLLTAQDFMHTLRQT